MTETFGSALERLRDVARGQAAGYRRLLDATREGTKALRVQDASSFGAILEEQIETLRELSSLERERAVVMRDVGIAPRDAESEALQRELRELASEVERENRVRRFVTGRLERLAETRLGFHRSAGSIPQNAPRGLDERA